MEKDIEKLSALMDDECSVEERDSILEKLCENPELQKRWQYYHAIRGGLRGEVAEFWFSTDNAAEILAAARREQRIYASDWRDRPSAWGRLKFKIADAFQQTSIWLGGAAVAASLGAVVLLGGFASEFTANQLNSESATVAGSTVDLDRQTLTRSTQWRSSDALSARQESLLGSFILAHSESASPSGRLHDLRLVSYDRMTR